jgi:phosphate butyryltransferase
MVIKSLTDFSDIAKKQPVNKLIVAAAEDEAVMKAVKRANNEGIIEPVLIGDEKKINEIAGRIEFDISKTEVYNKPDPTVAAAYAVELIKNGHGGILMKGLVTTSILLKAVIQRNAGMTEDNLLSHLAFFESPYYHKVFSITDAAMNISPDLNDKMSIIDNAVGAYHRLHIDNPKVAIIAAVETVNPKMEATIHAAMLTAMNKRNQIKGCTIDGPLAVDNAFFAEAAKHKNIISDVSGDVDILILPDINSGNVLYKSLNFLGGANSAAVILGAKVPFVLTSRADTEDSKFYSIALAAALG